MMRRLDRLDFWLAKCSNQRIRLIGSKLKVYDVILVATRAKFTSATRQSNVEPPIRPKLEIVQNKQKCLLFVYFMFTNK